MKKREFIIKFYSGVLNFEVPKDADLDNICKSSNTMNHYYGEFLNRGLDEDDIQEILSNMYLSFTEDWGR